MDDPLRPQVRPWYQGLLDTDHIYEHCPGRQRSLPMLRWAGWDGPGRGALDPLAGDVCGWCVRVWLARNPQWRDLAAREGGSAGG